MSACVSLSVALLHSIMTTTSHRQATLTPFLLHVTQRIISITRYYRGGRRAFYLFGFLGWRSFDIYLRQGPARQLRLQGGRIRKIATGRRDAYRMSVCDEYHSHSSPPMKPARILSIQSHVVHGYLTRPYRFLLVPHVSL